MSGEGETEGNKSGRYRWRASLPDHRQDYSPFLQERRRARGPSSAEVIPTAIDSMCFSDDGQGVNK